MTPAGPKTLFEKVWDAHVVRDLGDEEHLLYIDCHLVNEVTSPQAFEALRAAGRHVRAPQRTIAVADHNVPTDNREGGVAAITDPDSRIQVETLEANVRAFGVPYIPLTDRLQGIVHIIGPELGLTQPGMTIVCGDSHTSTHGAFGALAFGIGTSEAEHVLATQTLLQRRPRTMLIEIVGSLGTGVSAKDLALFIIQQIGTGGATGHVIEFGGETVRALDMTARMTLCNMAVEMGARAGMIAPDATTAAWLAGRRYAPKGHDWVAALGSWNDLASDAGARFDTTHRFTADKVVPMVTWGTSPEAAIGITDDIPDSAATSGAAQMLDYMGLAGAKAIEGVPIDMVFIGSCTNGRLEDLRQAAAVAAGRKVASGVRALVVPGSGTVKAEAEALGLDRVFLDAGFEWRAPGCSMCLGMNPDMLQPGQRCASTSNRNFEGRQGPGGRTHLVSPAMAAAAAVCGQLVDVRKLLP